MSILDHLEKIQLFNHSRVWYTCWKWYNFDDFAKKILSEILRIKLILFLFICLFQLLSINNTIELGCQTSQVQYILQHWQQCNYDSHKDMILDIPRNVFWELSKSCAVLKYSFYWKFGKINKRQSGKKVLWKMFLLWRTFFDVQDLVIFYFSMKWSFFYFHNSL